MYMENIFLKNLKYAKKYLIGKEFHKEQFDAALEVLDIYASKEPNTNFVILDALTQVGKTSVMEMIYRILNFEEIYKRYGIEHVIYMTADNGSGDGSLKHQTSDRFKQHWKNYIHSLPIDFLKRSDFDKFNHTLNNTLIMVDESQYGWREITSKGQRFLQIEGVNFCSVEEMQEKNMYILSVSATTQNERYGDSDLKLKKIVKLKPGEGYIGIEDFFDNNIMKSVVKDEFIDSYEKVNTFLANQRKKLEKIRKETNVVKCVIMRLVDNKRKGFKTDSEEFENIVDSNGFMCKLVTCNESKIDYIALQESIYYNCNCFNEIGKKYLLIVIKQAFSYAITIRPDIKKLIGTCYDVRKDNYSTEATEQGLPGRMTGYNCTLEDFNGLEIYVNETHYIGLKEKIEGNNEYAVPLKKYERNVQVICEEKEWDGNKKNIVIGNNEERKPLVFEGKVVDDWVKSIKKKIDINPLFSKEDIPSAVRNSYLRALAEDFLKKQGIFEKMGFGEDFFDSRRQRKENDNYAFRMCTSNPLLTNGCRQGWQTETKAKKGVICWGALFDISKANPKTLKGLVIKIPYGHVAFAKVAEITSLKSKKNKKWSGYNTSLNGVVKAPVTTV